MLKHKHDLLVQSDPSDPRRGVAYLAGSRFACALGKNGVHVDKREGDGATPAGNFLLRSVFYRPDRLAPPPTGLKLRPLDRQDGWCDDPAAADYNRLIRLPSPHRHEQLWREDHVYDLIVEVGYNDAPVVPGKGSAIFIHLAREDYAPTEGCIAFNREDLLAILARLGPSSRLVVSA
jgi:L,D-peptidoglycan transpeptidase YkuD (ErfK/YbiS/YcfS/YnhG family)